MSIINMFHYRQSPLTILDSKVQEEAWDLEIAWINTGKIEDLEKSLAEKRVYEYKQRKWRRDHGCWTHRIYVEANTIANEAFVGMQKRAKKVGTLGSEELGAKENGMLTFAKFNFCIISEVKFGEVADPIVIARQMYAMLVEGYDYLVHGLTVVAEPEPEQFSSETAQSADPVQSSASAPV